MFVPIHDGVPMRNLKAPYATYALIGLCGAVYLATWLDLLPVGETWLVAGLGVIPASLFGSASLPEGLPIVPEPLTLVTSLFVHLSLLHLAGNMLFLWVFGDNVEDAMGHLRFVLFFLACGVAGGFAHAYASPDSVRPLVGASGAVSGVVAAYLILHPRVRLWGLFFARIPLRLRAYWAIGFWLLFQIAQMWSGFDDSVGWVAHLGGFAAGAVLVLVLRRPDQPLLGAADGPSLTGGE
ncbi:rhomboid family intramembrane serine protease [Chelatococcus sp. SYSU_G07232]|uniref:Rhomboid family intramembrane serine protease n=1 Tax=Chelatococcus albus TaxID=3047466 RepID=A0ABT7AJK4_9HYPH|nr:rhomboid family intramembrane serine protease [Chelatococcus sp. SYSU_G07232]MDJ1159560.1 rhomboid family intramembrane serine protease [Chelatococcus sp. SYSU_G07232]